MGAESNQIFVLNVFIVLNFNVIEFTVSLTMILFYTNTHAHTHIR